MTLASFFKAPAATCSRLASVSQHRRQQRMCRSTGARQPASHSGSRCRSQVMATTGCRSHWMTIPGCPVLWTSGRLPRQLGRTSGHAPLEQACQGPDGRAQDHRRRRAIGAKPQVRTTACGQQRQNRGIGVREPRAHTEASANAGPGRDHHPGLARRIAGEDRMHLKYDLNVGALYIRLSDQAVARTRDIDDNTSVALDDAGNVVGIEVVSIAHPWPLNDILRDYSIPAAEVAQLRAYFCPATPGVLQEVPARRVERATIRVAA